MNDRRSEERLEVSLEAVWDGGPIINSRIIDLSDGGCFVDTTWEVSIGERLAFRIELPDGNWLELTGEVAHYMRPIGFGLHFVDVSDEVREQLRACIELMKKPHDPFRAVPPRNRHS